MSSARSDAVLEMLATDEILSSSSQRSKSLLRVASLDKDFRMSCEEGHSFCAELGLTDGQEGGVLVRPDQHILMRIYRETTAEDIAKAIREHLFGRL